MKPVGSTHSFSPGAGGFLGQQIIGRDFDSEMNIQFGGMPAQQVQADQADDSLWCSFVSVLSRIETETTTGNKERQLQERLSLCQHSALHAVNDPRLSKSNGCGVLSSSRQAGLTPTHSTTYAGEEHVRFASR
jgi:hypothetical protein